MKDVNDMLHAIYYKAMVGNYSVVEKTELYYGFTAANESLSRITSYYKEDLLAYKFYGPDSIIEDWLKYPYLAQGFKHED